MMFTRRQFIRSSVAGSLLLACSGWLKGAASGGLERRHPASPAESAMLAAIAGALLDGVLPSEAGERSRLLSETVDGIGAAVAGLSLATQHELEQLFGLLLLAPGRLLLAGVGKPWSEAGVGEVAQFLQGWRASRFSTLQSAYAALHDLTFGAWYARPESWPAIGYPGPARESF